VTDEPGLRARRVATSIRGLITELLVREVSDPAAAAFVVTAVELPDDLSVAWIKGRLLVGGEDPKKRKNVLAILTRVAGRLRRRLGAALRLKRMPELRFVYDEGADNLERVEALLSEISRERDGKP
jgi:ribosome-binding factor A